MNVFVIKFDIFLVILLKCLIWYLFVVCVNMCFYVKVLFFKYCIVFLYDFLDFKIKIVDIVIFKYFV